MSTQEKTKGGSIMSRTFHHGERRIRARGIRHDPPDLRRLARALIALAQAQAEAQAEADPQALTRKTTNNLAPAKKSPQPGRRDGPGDGRKESA
jgi:hypothetical protein